MVPKIITNTGITALNHLAFISSSTSSLFSSLEKENCSSPGRISVCPCFAFCFQHRPIIYSPENQEEDKYQGEDRVKGVCQGVEKDHVGIFIQPNHINTVLYIA